MCDYTKLCYSTFGLSNMAGSRSIFREENHGKMIPQSHMPSYRNSETTYFKPLIGCLMSIFCRRSGNGGPQTCLPAVRSVAEPAGRTAHLHQQSIQDPCEGPSLARRTMQGFLGTGLARQAHEERRYQGGANLTRHS